MDNQRRDYAYGDLLLDVRERLHSRSLRPPCLHHWDESNPPQTPETIHILERGYVEVNLMQRNSLTVLYL